MSKAFSFSQRTPEEEKKRWAAVKDEVADMIVAEHSNSDIRLRISAIWSIYLGDVQINAIRQKVAQRGRKNAFVEDN
jgi:hypothetical protein